MSTIKFTYALKRFFPELKDVQSSHSALPDLLNSLNESYPGIRQFVVDEHGALRKHVNIFIDGELIQDREKLSDKIGEKSEVYIMQALSGG